MWRNRFMWLVALAALAACRGTSCRGPSGRGAADAPLAAAPPSVVAPAALNLPDDAAGRVVARAINAVGGWEAWQRHRDAAFISTMTIFDPLGNATSETIFLHKLPLHEGMKTRLESIGLREEILFGFDGRDAWMLRDGQAVTEPARTAFTRFHAISTMYWFNLPFVLAEMPAALSYVGVEQDGDKRLEKVRVEYRNAVAAPADWLTIYVDADTGLIDRVHCHVTADFLRQAFWVGKWRDYRDCDGIKRERRRVFFPADLGGTVLGRMAAEQLVEHVRFDNGFPRELFTKPLAAGGGSPAG